MSLTGMFAFVCILTLGLPVFAADMPGEKMEATTSAGDKVVLHPNGRCILPGDKDFNRRSMIGK